MDCGPLPLTTDHWLHLCGFLSILFDYSLCLCVIGFCDNIEHWTLNSLSYSLITFFGFNEAINNIPVVLFEPFISITSNNQILSKHEFEHMCCRSKFNSNEIKCKVDIIFRIQNEQIVWILNRCIIIAMQRPETERSCVFKL